MPNCKCVSLLSVCSNFFYKIFFSSNILQYSWYSKRDIYFIQKNTYTIFRLASHVVDTSVFFGGLSSSRVRRKCLNVIFGVGSHLCCYHCQVVSKLATSWLSLSLRHVKVLVKLSFLSNFSKISQVLRDN